MSPQEATLLTREEIVRLLQEGAMKRRGLSAEELVHRFGEGRLENPGEILDLLALASLLEETDPLYVELGG